MTSFFDGSPDVDSMIKKAQINSAKLAYEKLLKQYPEHTIFLSFNYGCLNRSFIGNGNEARRSFQQAVHHRHEKENLFVEEPALNEFEANSIENLMLLSLSFEEFYSLADRLAALQPSAAILTQFRPHVESVEQEGGSWAEVMVRLAHGYYNMDGAKDPGMYGEALSTLQLLLQNLNQPGFQDPFVNYRTKLFDYIWVVLSAGYKQSLILYQNSQSSADPDEVKIIIRTARPLVEDFVKNHPGDQEAIEKLETFDKWLAFTTF